MKIKIAPDLEEITRDNNVFSCDFNNMHIEWCILEDCNDMKLKTEERLKQWLQTTIGMSSKMWQVPYLLNKHLPFASTIKVNGDIVEYPNEN